MILTRRNLLLALAALLSIGTSAYPHASMIRASPPANGSAQGIPRQVSIYFSERIRAAPDAITVTDDRGTRVDLADAKVDGNGRIVRTTLQPLKPGLYRVNWRVRSSDTHTAQGSFTFRVNP